MTIANPAAASLLGRAAARRAPSSTSALPGRRRAASGATPQRGRTTQTCRVRPRRRARCEATTYPVGGGADFTSIVVLRDVTAQARLERARRDLIANASHEFKTPLFSLAGLHSSSSTRATSSPDEQREFLQLMRQQVDRLRNLAVSMLDLSQVEAGSFELQPGGRRPRRRSASSVLRRVPGAGADQGARARRRGERRRRRRGATSSASPRCCARSSTTPSSTRRRAAPCGSSSPSRTTSRPSLVVARRRARASRRASCRTSSSASTAAARSAARRPAPGLGLSIARELTEMMGGSISAESPAGGGARFTVRLPRTRRRAPPARGLMSRAQARSQALTPRPRRCLTRP